MNFRFPLADWSAVFASALAFPASVPGQIEALPQTQTTLLETRQPMEMIRRTAGPVAAGSPRLAFPQELTEGIPLPKIIVATNSPAAVKWTRTGFWFLHLLEFDRAERCFRTALMHDKSCALASYGVAVAAMRTPARGRAWVKDAFSSSESLPENTLEREAAAMLWRFYDEKSGPPDERRNRLAQEMKIRGTAENSGVFWRGQALFWEYLNGETEFQSVDSKDFPAFVLMRRLAEEPRNPEVVDFKIPRTPLALTLKGMLLAKQGNGQEAEKYFIRALKAETALAEADGWPAEDLPAIAWRADILLESFADSGKRGHMEKIVRDLTRLPVDLKWNIAETITGEQNPPSCFLTGKRWLEKIPVAPFSPPPATPAGEIPAIALPQAAAWTLADARNRPHSLQDFHGKPLLLNFYLDHQCERCMHQMTQLARKLPEFEKMGIRVAAIGGDKPEDLARAVTFGDDPRPFPFPLLADPDFRVHRNYGCWHDFSNLPQHGTVLVSAEGRILWRNTAEGPFENMDFLLAESKRLLELEPPASAR